MSVLSSRAQANRVRFVKYFACLLSSLAFSKLRVGISYLSEVVSDGTSRARLLRFTGEFDENDVSEILRINSCK